MRSERARAFLCCAEATSVIRKDNWPAQLLAASSLVCKLLPCNDAVCLLKWNKFFDVTCVEKCWFDATCSTLEIGYYPLSLPLSINDAELLWWSTLQTWQESKHLKANSHIYTYENNCNIFIFCFFPTLLILSPIFLYKYSQLVVLTMMIWLLLSAQKIKKTQKF